MAWGRGTGAASYQGALRNAVAAAGYRVEALVDALPGACTPLGRVRRWAAAAWPGSARTGSPTAGERLAPDVFRRAQVHFDVHGRYLRLRGPAPPALMHWSYPLPLRMAGVPNVYSVLDLIPLLQPELTPIRQDRAARMLRRLAKEAAHLTTISEASRREIVGALGWPPGRVTNVSLSVDVSGAAPVADACAAAGVVPGGFWLHAGTVERRKNVARLVAAYRASGSGRALVLAGPDGWGAAEELAGAGDLLAAPPGMPRVVRIDWMARPALLGLMAGAAAVLAPSLAEGFGLPAMEAMALGTPALTSRGGAPEEAAGGAALLVDALDVRDMAAGIAALDGDAHRRTDLAVAGRVRAAAFTTGAFAARLAALYRQILGTGA